MINPDAARHETSRQKHTRWARLALTAFNVALFVFFARWLMQNVRSDVLADHFSVIPAWAILGSMFINFAALACYGLRMAFILRERFVTSFSVINIGYALNTIIPLRIGEAVKIVMVHRLYGIPATKLVAATFLEKLVDLFTLVVLGLVLAAIAAGRYVNAGMLVLPLVLVIGAIGAVWVFRMAVAHIDNFLPKKSRLRRIMLELHKHASDYPLTRIIAITILIWSLNVLSVYFVFNTYLGHIGFGLLDAIALLVLLALAIAVPSAPASIGLFEAGVITYLTQLFDVSSEAALATAVVFHLAISVPQLVYLAVVLLHHRMRAVRNLPH